MTKKFIGIILITLMCFCNRRDNFLYELFIEKGNPNSIEFMIKSKITLMGQKSFIITDKFEINIAMNEIKSTNQPSVWKGAQWNILKLNYSDTIITLYTNNYMIGLENNGIFYKLLDSNFITKKLN